MRSGESQKVEIPGTSEGLRAAHPVPGVSVSKPENCTLRLGCADPSTINRPG